MRGANEDALRESVEAMGKELAHQDRLENIVVEFGELDNAVVIEEVEEILRNLLNQQITEDGIETLYKVFSPDDVMQILTENLPRATDIVVESDKMDTSVSIFEFQPDDLLDFDSFEEEF